MTIRVRSSIRITRNAAGSRRVAAIGCSAGRSAPANRAGAANGYDHFEVVVDDATRLAYVAHVPDESGASAALALVDAAYNHNRPHTALDGQAPMTSLVNNVRGKHT
jgi:hypothetical protein